ncbi:MAG: hypothetical protein ACI9U2_003357 [Bradymonadia bacterium]|jgi:hypothetical protein
MPAAYEEEHMTEQRTVATDSQHHALERWENEGGSVSRRMAALPSDAKSRTRTAKAPRSAIPTRPIAAVAKTD